jgi:hypothetical protein
VGYKEVKQENTSAVSYRDEGNKGRYMGVRMKHMHVSACVWGEIAFYS